jgi:hypothetical protein
MQFFTKLDAPFRGKKPAPTARHPTIAELFAKLKIRFWWKKPRGPQRLPDEVLKNILPYLPNSSLCSIARTSRYLGNRAQLLLHRDIQLQHTTSTYNQSEWDLWLLGTAPVPASYSPLRLVETLRSNSHLFSRIDSLDLEIITNMDRSHWILSEIVSKAAPTVRRLRLSFTFLPKIGKQRGCFGCAFHQILQETPLLERLELFHAPNFCSSWVVGFLESAPRLETLLINIDSRDTSTFLAPSIQPDPSYIDSVRELHISHTGKMLPLTLLRLIEDAGKVERLVCSMTPALLARTMQKRGVNVWTIIGAKAHLQSLVWEQGSCREFWYMLKKVGGFQELEALVVGDGHMREGDLTGVSNPGARCGVLYS